MEATRAVLDTIQHAQAPYDLADQAKRITRSKYSRAREPCAKIVAILECAKTILFRCRNLWDYYNLKAQMRERGPVYAACRPMFASHSSGRAFSLQEVGKARRE